MNSSICDTCEVNARLARMGMEVLKFDRVIALAGNPNTGKSTLFNALTGLKQHTGNWPGKTVTRAEGGYEFKNKRYKLVDLPGTYSLLSVSQDEEVARDFLLFGQPDCSVVVCDATALERNLNLVLQVMEITDKVVVALNLMDEARRKGLEIDTRNLSRDLGVPVIPLVARTGEGVRTLLSTIDDLISGVIQTRPFRIRWNEKYEAAVNELVGMIEAIAPGIPNARWLAFRLLDGDASVENALLKGELPLLVTRQKESDNSFSQKIALAGNQ